MNAGHGYARINATGGTWAHASWCASANAQTGHGCSRIHTDEYTNNALSVEIREHPWLMDKEALTLPLNWVYPTNHDHGT